MCTARSVFLLVALVAIAAGQPPKNCCTPPKWEGKFDVISAGVSGVLTYFIQEFQRVSMDTTTHKVARVMTLIENGVRSEVTIIQDFDAGMQYRISNGKCTTSSLEAWTPKCVPDDAKLVLKTYFGAGNDSLDIDAYMYSETINDYVMSVSSRDCTPVNVAVTSTEQNTPIGYTIGTYSNITVGILDPSVFNVPDICNNPPVLLNVQGRFLRGVF